MQKRRLCRSLGLVCIVLLVSLALLSPSPGHAKPKFHWRYQCAFAEADMSYTQTVEIAKMIEEASEGQVKVDTYSVGALVGPEELFSSVADGTIEAGYNMSMSEAEIIPVSLFLAIHGGPQNMDEMYDYMYGTDTFKLVQEGYREKGLHLLCSAGVGRILLRARKTGVLENWESFKGTKGFASPQVIPVLTKLGGVCVEVPGFDMYSAMRLGSIDWHEWTIAELETLGWKEVTKVVLVSPVTQVGACNTFVNLKAWEALGPELQEKIQSRVLAGMDDLARAYIEENNKAIAASKEYGVKFIEMSETDKARYTKLCVEDWASLGEKNPRCAKALEILKDWMRKKGRL
jgi:TRAP-type mannitol/chloroaromatic compound transport system substrate-binding protein